MSLDYYSTMSLVEDLKIILACKEVDLMNIQLNEPNDLNQNIKKNQLFYEINELKMQLQYHENLITDQMMNNCCSNGCCFK